MTNFVRDKEPRIANFAGDMSVPIWRYQDLTKLLWTVANRSLWFARADMLGDPYEGSAMKSFYQLFSDAYGPSISEALELYSQVSRAGVRFAAMNCWHMSEHESAAMWKLYINGGQGIAIRSTVERLVRAFQEGVPTDIREGNPDTPQTIRINFGAVHYIDHHTDKWVKGPLDPTDAFFRKRKSFSHEQEFRALVFNRPVRNGRLDLDGDTFPEGGVAIPVDLERLIEEIHIFPGARVWVTSVVEAALEKFGVDLRVRQSNLDRDPLF